MKLKHLALTALVALALVAPGVSAEANATQSADLNCTGTPTNISIVDRQYQNACDTVQDACDVFDPCPLDPRFISA